MSKRIYLIAIVLVPVLLFFGCSEGPPQILSGTVEMDGKPLPYASVTFARKQGEKYMQAGGSTDENGRFEISLNPAESHLKAGKYTVLLYQNVDSKGNPIVPTDEPSGDDPSKDIGQLMAGEELKNALPEKYNDPDESPLSIEIKEGDNTDLQIKFKSN